MRVLGIDLGTKRIGIALSDASGTLASPLTVIQRTKDRAAFARQLREIVAENEVERIVVGLPLSLSGKSGRAAKSAVAEINRLRGTIDVPIELYDERLTTVTAQRLLGEADIRGQEQRAIVDQAAAAVILQAWLDSAAEQSPRQEL